MTSDPGAMAAPAKDGTDLAYLPHSCDEWIIGDADDVRALIADLQALLPKMEAPK